MSKKTITYKQTNKLQKKLNRVVKFGVDSNPFGDGEYNEIYFGRDHDNLLSSFKLITGYYPDKHGIDYEWTWEWQDTYTGKFYLLEGEDYGDFGKTKPTKKRGRPAKSKITLEDLAKRLDKIEVTIANPSEEEKPKIKYNENGSLAVKPIAGDTYWFINSYGKVDYAGWTDDHMDYYHFQTENCFDTEEAGLIWADVLKTHYRLLEKIKEINESVGWVADYGNHEQAKYELTYDYGDDKVKRMIWNNYYGFGRMSEKACDYMMSDKVSEEDRIKFLKIVKR